MTFKFELGTTDSSGKISGVEIARCSLRLVTCFCFFLEKDFCKSSFTVSGGWPSFFLLFLTVIFGARDGLVCPICSWTLFHRSACPYRIGTPSVDLYYNSPFWSQKKKTHWDGLHTIAHNAERQLRESINPQRRYGFYRQQHIASSA